MKGKQDTGVSCLAPRGHSGTLVPSLPLRRLGDSKQLKKGCWEQRGVVEGAQAFSQADLLEILALRSPRVSLWPSNSPL